jgi:hypothetical protein
MLEMLARFVRPLVILVLIISSVSSIFAQESEIKSVADALSRSLSNANRPRVAVVDLTDLQGGVTPLGRYMAEELETALANTGGSFDLIDRTRLKLLMQENKLASTGVIDPSTARQLGKIAGVHILITGTLVPMSDTVRMTIKALDTEDAHVVAAVPRNLLMTRALMQLVGQVPSAAPTPGDVPFDSGATGAPSVPPAIQTPRPMVTEAQQVNFTLKSCAHSSSAVICHLALTNTGEDRDARVITGCTGWDSRLIDDNGREAIATHVIVGSKEGGQCQGAETTLVSGVTTGVELTFDKVASDAASIALLEIAGEVGEKRYKVQFRKVPLSSRR